MSNKDTRSPLFSELYRVHISGRIFRPLEGSDMGGNLRRLVERHRRAHLMRRLAEHQQAVLQSQSGPLAGLAFWLEPHLFRIVPVRRLRLSLRVGVAVSSIIMATIELRALEQGIWEGGVPRW